MYHQRLAFVFMFILFACQASLVPSAMWTISWLYVLTRSCGKFHTRILCKQSSQRGRTIINAGWRGTILTFNGEAKTKLRNYSDKANLAVLGHSKGTFTVVHGLYWQFFSNCRCPDSFIDAAALGNTHFPIVPVVIPTRHVQSARALIEGDND